MATQYDFVLSDTHLEVLPERWSGRVDAKYRDKIPRTVPHPNGGDAIYILKGRRCSRSPSSICGLAAYQ